MPKDAGQVTRLEKYKDFTSADSNHGIPLNVQFKGDKAFSDVTIPESMAGWRSPDHIYAHKGAVATVLETVMALGGIHFLRMATNAKTLSIEYFTQVPTNTKLRAESRLVRKRGENEAIIEGTLQDDKGTVLAHSTGTYVTYSVEQLRNAVHGPFPELALGPNLRNVAACAPEDVTRFEKTLQNM